MQKCLMFKQQIFSVNIFHNVPLEHNGVGWGGVALHCEIWEGATCAFTTDYFEHFLFLWKYVELLSLWFFDILHNLDMLKAPPAHPQLIIMNTPSFCGNMLNLHNKDIMTLLVFGHFACFGCVEGANCTFTTDYYEHSLFGNELLSFSTLLENKDIFSGYFNKIYTLRTDH